MKAHEEYMLFLEEHPELHSLTKSGLYLSVILFLAKQGKTMIEIMRSFPSIEEEDVELIVKSLISVGAVKKINALGKEVYYAEDIGKELLEKYNNAKKDFSAFE